MFFDIPVNENRMNSTDNKLILAKDKNFFITQFLEESKGNETNVRIAVSKFVKRFYNQSKLFTSKTMRNRESCFGTEISCKITDSYQKEKAAK